MSEEFTLNYHAATIQHLGIGLYKQLPQAIAELITNSWDADSHKVQININYKEKIIIVSDDGNGMSAKEINENFLTIARNRRLTDKQNDEKRETGLSKNGRKVTGKKGLGKLALFGIANTISIDSIQNGKLNSFELNYNDIQSSSNSVYHPKTIHYNVQIDEPNGTKITIKDITLKNLTKIDTLYDSLSKRFNKYSRTDFLVTLASDDGTIKELDEEVFINSIRPKEVETEFTFSFPDDFETLTNKQSQIVIHKLKEFHINGIIYTKKTPLQANQRGFSVLSRGKLASEQSVTQFQDRANDNFYSYAAGYFNIDFLDDDNKKDFISTDRQSIRWEADEELIEIKENLNKLIGIIQREWRKRRSEAKEKKAQENIQKNSSLVETTLSTEDQKSINKISKALENDDVDVPEQTKQDILESAIKSTTSYKKDHSVYKELVPPNFRVPKTVGQKIRMLREEMLEAAEDKNIDRFILTQGLLLRAMIESTTTTLLKRYWEEASTHNLIIENNRPKTLTAKNKVDKLSFKVKYETIVRLLSRKGKIAPNRVQSLIDEFSNIRATEHLNTLMHDAHNFPQFDTLKTIWNAVAPQLLAAFELL